MKQVFYATGMLMLIICGKASAQTTETSFITKGSIINSPFVAGVKSTVAIAKISVIAVDRFKKDYKDAKDVEWVELQNGYRAYFLQDAVLTAVDYTKKGKLYSVIRYGKGLLAADVKLKLDDMFDHMQIKEVTEVKIADFATKAYVIVLEDNKALRTVQVIEDEISVISEVEK